MRFFGRNINTLDTLKVCFSTRKSWLWSVSLNALTSHCSEIHILFWSLGALKGTFYSIFPCFWKFHLRFLRKSQRLPHSPSACVSLSLVSKFQANAFQIYSSFIHLDTAWDTCWKSAYRLKRRITIYWSMPVLLTVGKIRCFRG